MQGLGGAAPPGWDGEADAKAYTAQKTMIPSPR